MLQRVGALKGALATSSRLGSCVCAVHHRASSSFAVHTPPAKRSASAPPGTSSAQTRKRSSPNSRQRRARGQEVQGTPGGFKWTASAGSSASPSKSPQHRSLLAAFIASDLDAASRAYSEVDLKEVSTAEHRQLLHLATTTCATELADRHEDTILRPDRRSERTIKACALCIQVLSGVTQSEDGTGNIDQLLDLLTQWLSLEVRYGNGQYVVSYVENWLDKQASGSKSHAPETIQSDLHSDESDETGLLPADTPRAALTRPHAAALLALLIIARAAQSHSSAAPSGSTASPASDQHLRTIVNLVRPLSIGYPGYLFFGRRATALINDAIPGVSDEAVELRERATRWLRYIELARGLDVVEPIESSINQRGGREQLTRLMGSLVAQGHLDEVEILCQAAMEAADAGWLRMSAGDVIHRAAQRWHWTPGTWAVIIAGLLSADRTAAARTVWLGMCGRRPKGQGGPSNGGHPTSARVWRAMIDGQAARGNWDAVKATWDQLWSLDTTTRNTAGSRRWRGPDANVYTSFLSATFHARQPDSALSVFSKMRQEEAKGTLALPEVELEASDNLANAVGGKIPVETYNVVLHGLYTNRRASAAQLLLHEMLKSGPSPNISTINTLIRAQGRAGDFDGMADTLRSLATSGLEPDVVTFTSVLDAMLRNRSRRTQSISASDAVTRVLGLMERTGVQPNAITYTALITSLIASPASHETEDLREEHGSGTDTAVREHEKLHAALGILATMEDAARNSRAGVIHPLRPTEVTYTALMAFLSRQVSHSSIADAIPAPYSNPPRARSDLSESDSDMRTLTQQEPGIAASLVLLDRMRRLHLEPNRKTCNYLLASLLGTFNAVNDRPAATSNAVLLRRGMSILRDMLASSSPLVQPNVRTWHTVLSSLTKRAAAQLQQSRETREPRELDSLEALAFVVQVLPSDLLQTATGRALNDAVNKARQLLKHGAGVQAEQ